MHCCSREPRVAAGVVSPMPQRATCCAHLQSRRGTAGCARVALLAQQGTHADLFTLSPASPGKRIGVDAIRDLLAFMAKTSALGARKVVLVTALDAFTTSAFNAFLKGLEEPADDAYLLLVAARGQGSYRRPYVLAVNVSRCRHRSCPRRVSCWKRSGAPPPTSNSRPRRFDSWTTMPEQPLAALELAREDLAVPLLALPRSSRRTRGEQRPGSAESAAKGPRETVAQRAAAAAQGARPPRGTGGGTPAAPTQSAGVGSYWDTAGCAARRVESQRRSSAIIGPPSLV